MKESDHSVRTRPRLSSSDNHIPQQVPVRAGDLSLLFRTGRMLAVRGRHLFSGQPLTRRGEPSNQFCKRRSRSRETSCFVSKLLSESVLLRHFQNIFDGPSRRVMGRPEIKKTTASKR